MKNLHTALVACVFVMACGSSECWAQSGFENLTWDVVKPTSTGIPGEEARVLAFAPDGSMWVGARWPFYGEGGIGVYDSEENKWHVHSNVVDAATIPFPSALVNDIEFTSDGTVWVATDDGLAHFNDGIWSHYRASNSPMPYDIVQGIELDAQGRVWLNVLQNPQFGSGSAVMVFDGATWQSWSVGNGLPWSSPGAHVNRGIAVDAQRRVWVGGNLESGLTVFDGTTWTHHPATGVPHMEHPFAASSGHVWAIGKFFNSFHRFDGTTYESFDSTNTPFVNTTVTALAEDATGRIYVGNWLGQIIRESAPGSGIFELFASVGDRVYDLHPMPGGELCCRKPFDIARLDATGNLIQRFNTYNTGMPDYDIDNIQLDRDGFLWLASSLGGLSRFDGTRWRNWGNFNRGAEPYPWAGSTPMGGFLIDDQDRGWMGGPSGIGQWDPATGQFTGYWDWMTDPLGNVYTHFAQDDQGEVFGANRNGNLVRFTGTGWENANGTLGGGGYSSGYPGIFDNQNGTTYVVRPHAIHTREQGEWMLLADVPEGKILSFAAGPDGVFWIGTDEGLVRIDGEVRDHFTPDNSPMPAYDVRGVDVRSDGLVAVSCSDFTASTPYPNGVCLIDGDPGNAANWHISTFANSPIPHYQLQRLAFDAAGDLWVSAASEGCAVARTSKIGVLLGDVNLDGSVNLLDVAPFVALVSSGEFQPEADINQDGVVSLLDVAGFVELLTGE